MCLMLAMLLLGVLGLSEVETLGELVADANTSSAPAAAEPTSPGSIAAAAAAAVLSVLTASSPGAGRAGGNEEYAALTDGMVRHDGFFTMFTDNSSAPTKVLFSIDEAQLESPFLVSALRQRADGFSHSTTLHYPLEQSLWQWARSPGNDADERVRGADASTTLDLGMPQLSVRASATEPVRGPQADGIWGGWAKTLPVAAINTTEQDGGTIRHLVDVTGLLTDELLASVIPGGIHACDSGSSQLPHTAFSESSE